MITRLQYFLLGTLELHLESIGKVWKDDDTRQLYIWFGLMEFLWLKVFTFCYRRKRSVANPLVMKTKKDTNALIFNGKLR